MDIAIVRKKFTFHGGAETFIMELAGRLRALGHTVHIVAAGWDEASSRADVVFHRVPIIGFNSLLRDLSFALMSRRVICAGRFDLVQSHDKTLLQDIYRADDGCHRLWLRQRNRGRPLKTVSTFLNPYHWLVLALERSIMKGHRFRRIVAVSDMVRRELCDTYGVNPSDVAVIYNAIDTVRFHPDNVIGYREETRRLLDIPGDATVALFVGSGFERKGVPCLMRSLRHIKSPLAVVVAGKGRPMSHADPSGNKRVIFTGPVRDVHRYYAASDMFVLPAIYEPFGNVVIEAMATGIPAIVSSCAGAAEAVEHGLDGLILSDPRDPVELARHMEALMDPAVRARMAPLARAKAETYNFDRHMRETGELYAELMKDKR